jgi:ATP-dependent DNA helicase RecG
MRSLYDKLFKILKAEQGKGYTNQAVIGGLEGFLSFWLTEARKTANTPQERSQVEEVVTQLSGYAGLNPAERTQRVQYLFERLGGGNGAQEAESGKRKAESASSPPIQGREGRETREAGRRAQEAESGKRTTPHPSTPLQEGEQRANTPPYGSNRPQEGQGRRETPEGGRGGRDGERRAPEAGRGAQNPNERPGQNEGRGKYEGDRGKPSNPNTAMGDTQRPPREREPRRDPAPSVRESVPTPTRARTEPALTTAEPRPSVPPAPSPAEVRAARSTVDAPRERVKAKVPPFQRRVWASEEMQRAERELDRPITTIPGIGTVKAEKYQRLGIISVRDLLMHVPFRYEDYTTLKTISELMYGDEVTIAGVVQDVSLFKTPKGMITVTAKISDGTGMMTAKWFGNKYLINQLPVGAMLRLSGKVEAYLGKLELSGPRFEQIDAEELRNGRLVAIYPRTEGLTEKIITGDIARALEHTAGKIPDPLPMRVREQHDLPDVGQALRWIHQPQDLGYVEAARRRLAFDELLRLQLGLLQQRRAWRNQAGTEITVAPDLLERFTTTLPFSLTEAQQRSLNEILGDMAKPYSMSRLLQGDVGSGKTVVGAAALLAAVAAGYQGALMAPTEILAEQHYTGLSRFLNPETTALLERPIRVALLTGSMSAKEKEETRQAILAGVVDVVVGTHALIQQDVVFAKLGIAIVDEQHRFGVQQRGMLRSQANEVAPDLLVMSATPIPRSLALTLYGDLDLSIIDQLPPGREPIVTRAITAHQRERAYTYIRRQLTEGRQAFIICPLVEESDKLEAKAAVDEHRFLQEQVFPDFRVELLHGRMRPDDKEAAMGRFYRNESQILVSTSVVEVGIDVPNATVMLVEGANRFGLAQLHQFRGRIGRGAYRSLCLLMAEDGISADGEMRLQTLVEHSDGFKLAEQDLAMRGPGDFFGTRQSGLPLLKMAQLGDSVALHTARTAAADLLAQDPDLLQPEHQLLRQQKERYWSGRSGNLS